MCKYCKRKNNFADVGIKLDTEKYRVYLCGGNSKPPEDERFDFCPKCGIPLGEVKPLTVEQLKQMKGKPIWVELIGCDYTTIELVGAFGFNIEEKEIVSLYNAKDGLHNVFFDKYGTTWLAYPREPKGEAE